MIPSNNTVNTSSNLVWLASLCRVTVFTGVFHSVTHLWPIITISQMCVITEKSCVLMCYDIVVWYQVTDKRCISSPKLSDQLCSKVAGAWSWPPLPSAEGNNEWSDTPTPPCAFMTCTGTTLPLSLHSFSLVCTVTMKTCFNSLCYV